MHTPLQFAQDLTAIVTHAWKDGSLYEAVTPTTRALLTHWFSEAYTSSRSTNFHDGQRQAILNTIYAHEVLGGKQGVKHLYQSISNDLLLDSEISSSLDQEKYQHAKYCIKMATGTGKTWVLSALIIWQYLNSLEDYSHSYTRNFLLIAPGLIVYERLLDAFLGKEGETGRNIEEADIYALQELFLPEIYRDTFLHFLSTSVIPKEDISKNVTRNGMIAITNWHALSEKEEYLQDLNSEDIDPYSLMKSIPLPGKSAGNSLYTLDKIHTDIIEFFRYLPDVMICNDEAHHIHDRTGEDVQWQQSIQRIIETKPQRSIQIDFSATPYTQQGNQKKYFPHIIVNFELKEAIQQGLVKTIVLDERQELATLPLDFRAERDEQGKVCGISEGQRVMIRAGLAKLQILEDSFHTIAPEKQPKMLIVCEDTTVVPFVESFLQEEHVDEDEMIAIHSNKKGEVGEKEWNSIKKKLSHIDQHRNPRVIISVLMLREGFDVNNICVVVPLRSTQSNILLEQTIGRGLRLMWREPEFQEEKEENRKLLLVEKASPKNYFDILSVIEHPSFKQFYLDLMEGCFGVETQDIQKEGSTLGNMEVVSLQPNYKKYDFIFPIVIQDAEEELSVPSIDIKSLSSYPIPLQQLKKLIRPGEIFVSEEVTSRTRFGNYSVHGGILSATSYNDYIRRLVTRISHSQSPNLKSLKNSTSLYPTSHIAFIAEVVDTYIRDQLFGVTIEPFQDHLWRVLLIDKVSEHIISTIARALSETTQHTIIKEAEVVHRKLSEVTHVRIRSQYAIPTTKSIYHKTGYPSHRGLFEKSFIEYADQCSSVYAHIKIQPAHYFVRLRYMRPDGLSAYYHPDFFVRSLDNIIYLVETKGDDQMEHPIVQRKKQAALFWIERVNALPPEKRDHAKWKYVLLNQSLFDDWRHKGASMKDILEFQTLLQSSNQESLL